MKTKHITFSPSNKEQSLFVNTSLTSPLTNSLPKDYVAKKFMELGYKARYMRHDDAYNCCCPICHEGKSWGKKKRCWYLPSKDLIYCFNCGWSSRPMKWIMEVGGLSYRDVKIEVEKGEYSFINLDNMKNYELETPHINQDLPEDSINLFNELQLAYYKDNSVVQKALGYVKDRRLDTAVNRPKGLYVSLNDPTHKNRIIIPFYDAEGGIPFYQSRAFGGNIDGHKEDVRYLSKKHAGRTLFNVNNIDTNIPYLFLFEGPIDACFVKNGLAVAGINLSKGKDLTAEQEEQLAPYQFTHDQIWMLDSQWLDETSKKKTQLLLQAGERVFIWPKNLGEQYKDFNEYCVSNGKDEVPYDFIIKNSLCGEADLLKFKLLIGNS